MEFGNQDGLDIVFYGARTEVGGAMTKGVGTVYELTGTELTLELATFEIT